MSDRIGNRDLARILSPLALFLLHVVHLVWFSRDPFLTRWLEGSFTFFMALVLCNVIRSRVVAAKAQQESGGEDDPAPEDDLPLKGPPDRPA